MKELETKVLLIRKPQMKDADFVYQNWNHKESVTSTLTERKHVTLQEIQAIMASCIIDFETDLPTWTVTLHDGEVIGYIKVDTASITTKQCTISYYLLPSYESLYAEELLKEVIQFLMVEQGYDTVIFKLKAVDACKTKMKKDLLERIGAKREGILRNRSIHRLTGKKIDIHIFSILKEEVYMHS